MKVISILALLLATSGCTLIGGVTGMAAGVVDCTVAHVMHSGPAGLILLPLGPFEGAYHGAQLGWMADKAIWNDTQAPRMLAYTIPCNIHYVIKAFNGKGLTWDIQ